MGFCFKAWWISVFWDGLRRSRRKRTRHEHKWDMWHVRPQIAFCQLGIHPQMSDSCQGPPAPPAPTAPPAPLGWQLSREAAAYVQQRRWGYGCSRCGGNLPQMQQIVRCYWDVPTLIIHYPVVTVPEKVVDDVFSMLSFWDTAFCICLRMFEISGPTSKETSANTSTGKSQTFTVVLYHTLAKPCSNFVQRIQTCWESFEMNFIFELFVLEGYQRIPLRKANTDSASVIVWSCQVFDFFQFNGLRKVVDEACKISHQITQDNTSRAYM